jgi:hypothetical protein
MLGKRHEREVLWLMDGGLGPMLYRATRERFDYVPSALRDVLLSSDLTAQVRHACVINTAQEVIDVCEELGTPLTLLKGISISDQYYPAPHLRPMGDIDLLVPPEASKALESALLCRGYDREPGFVPGEGMHHGVPLYQPKHRVWVEVHNALYPRYDSLMRERLFSTSDLAAKSVPSRFHGRSVYRLADELQLIYIASSWMRDLTVSGVHPCFLISLLDAVHLLKSAGTRLDWDKLLGWLDNSMAIASLYVTLGYLSRHRLYELSRETQTYLRRRQDLVGRFQLQIIHSMLDHWLIGARPWSIPLPPPVPARYNLRHQLRKRWTLRRVRPRSPD